MAVSQQQDLEAVVNTLLKSIKQQPAKTEVKIPTWIEQQFGIPKSPEEALWRICWLVVVPAVATLCYLPIADWCWYNGYPLIAIVVTLAIALGYWLIGQFAINAAGSLEKLVTIQLAIPGLTVFFIFVWEILSRG